MTSEPTPSASSQESWLKKLTTDAFLLAVLSAVGYWVAIAYETGYAAHFGYPSYLIAPTIPITVSAIALLVGSFLTFTSPVLDMFKSDPAERKIAKWILLLSAISLFCYSTFVFSNFSWRAIVSILVVLGMGSIAFLAARVDVQKNVKTSRAAVYVALLIVGAMALQLGARFVGLENARTQKVFYFLESDPDLAVVRTFDNVAVAVRFDRWTNSFEGRYLVLRGDDLNRMALKRIALTGDRIPVMKSGEP